MPLKKSFSDLVSESRRRNDEVDADELAQRLDNEEPGLIVIDVREDGELVGGLIPGSIHIGRGVLERDIERRVFNGLAKDADLAKPIVLYCAGGNRSLLAADALKQMGFTNVLSLIGGFRAWAGADRKIEFPTRII
jgi:rhodanese-related sulfurtransferase